MKTMVAVAVAVLLATPAFAAGGKKKVQRYHQSYNQMAPWEVQQRGYGRGDPYEVRSYGGRRVVGRDPDPNIRRSLRDEDAFFRREP